ncbi:MAG: nucleotidyltransferase substrate binding protein [Fusobacteriaceae bacterium]|nr:nucleotidyltransferase substrate binding protein [Fusobacteriaceae bacterium]MBN2838048.1 nucleotidyltransferase substrate binding protein [Fusobacteriaceae bacterium]
MKRWSERIKDLGNAVERLNEAIEDSNNYKLETLKDSVIHRFEFSLELSWKALKNYLNSQILRGFWRQLHQNKQLRKLLE